MIKILLSTFCLVGSTIETRCPFVLTSTLYCVNIRRRRRINDEKFVKIYDNWAKRKQKISWKWGDFRKVSINLSSRAWNPGRERSLAVWTNPNINSEARGGPHIMWHRQFFICTSLHVIIRAGHGVLTQTAETVQNARKWWKLWMEQLTRIFQLTIT